MGLVYDSWILQIKKDFEKLICVHNKKY